MVNAKPLQLVGPVACGMGIQDLFMQRLGAAFPDGQGGKREPAFLSLALALLMAGSDRSGAMGLCWVFKAVHVAFP